MGLPDVIRQLVDEPRGLVLSTFDQSLLGLVKAGKVSVEAALGVLEPATSRCSSAVGGSRCRPTGRAPRGIHRGRDRDERLGQVFAEMPKGPLVSFGAAGQAIAL